MNANADVEASGINPLVHYIRHGISELRNFGPNVGLIARSSRAIKANPVSFSLISSDGSPAELRATLCSLAAVSGAPFELVLGMAGATVAETIDALKHRGEGQVIPEVRVVASEEQRTFLRDAIEATQNDFIILLEAGDVVSEEALAMLSGFILEKACDVVYCDELFGSEVVLKPSWSPELLTAYNYFGHLTAIRRSVALEALPSAATRAAAEWDLNLRIAEFTHAIEHLPATLCRRSSSGGKRRRLPEGDIEAHVEVIQAYWRRQNHDARITRGPDGTFRATWMLSERPLVSIIIPNKDGSSLLRACVEGLYDNTAYNNFELIIVDNGSTEAETLVLYEELLAKSARVVPFDETFNYSRACNLGAAEARGEFLLFLNNDIEVVQPDWLDELVRQASEPSVGVVGAKLLYPDGAIQHAGIALGLFTLSAHVFHRAPENLWGPIGTPNTTRNWIAVTGACQLMRRELFDLVDGYDEDFLVSYSDIVLCMDIVRAGFRTVYLPSAVLIHREGASRGRTNPPVDQRVFAKRVRSLGVTCDPFFHPSLDTESFVPVVRQEGAINRGVSPFQLDIDRIAGPISEVLDIFDDGAVCGSPRRFHGTK